MKEFAIHYHLKDNVHEIDAKTLNQCESEVLSIIEQVITSLELNLNTELIVRTEGGIRDILKFSPKTKQDEIIVNGVITFLIGTIIALSSHYIFYNRTEHKLELDSYKANIEATKAEIKSVQINKEQLELQQKQLELLDNIDSKLNELNNNEKSNKEFQRKQSRLYRNLNGYEKIEALSVEEVNKDDKHTYNEIVRVEKVDFPKFITESRNLEPVEDKDAVIKIISPVLNDNGRYTWRGDYKGEVIDFYMKDKDFKRDILLNRIKFGANDLLSGILIINHKINDVGEEVITGYSMPVVFGFEHDNGSYTETVKGRKERNKPIDNEQLNLFKND